jgi:hypothetical protein
VSRGTRFLLWVNRTAKSKKTETDPPREHRFGRVVPARLVVVQVPSQPPQSSKMKPATLHQCAQHRKGTLSPPNPIASSRTPSHVRLQFFSYRRTTETETKIVVQFQNGKERSQTFYKHFWPTRVAVPQLELITNLTSTMDAFGAGSGMSWPQLAEGQEDFVEYRVFSNQALQKTTQGTQSKKIPCDFALDD